MARVAVEQLAATHAAATEDAVPPEFRLGQPLIQREWLSGGTLHTWAGPQQDILSPVLFGGRPRVIGSSPLLTATESLAALDAAEKAFAHGHGVWPTMTVGQRIACVMKFVSLMKLQRQKVVNLLMWEIGKSLGDSQKEFDRTVQYVVDTVDALKDLDRVCSRFAIHEGIVAQVRRSPLGVALCMAPFNYPFNELFTTLIPALIMGNTVIFKPAKYGVLIHQPLLSAYRDSFPPGVLNTVYGEGSQVIGPLMTSGKIDVLAFIGTSRVADILKKQHPKPHRLRSVLGLEAKNPAVILPDADLDVTTSECLLGALSFNGQRCTAIKIIFVHETIAPAFVQRLSAAVEALKPGFPWTPGVNLTSLPENGKPGWMKDYVQDAERHGAKVINPSGGISDPTFFFPAILYPVSSAMKIFREEQFGPVIPVVPFTATSEVISYVIESQYGQQISIFGKDTGQIAQLVDGFVNQTCRVNINCQCQRGPDVLPFTGRKDSAEGTLSVSDALRALSIRTLVATKSTALNQEILTDITHNHKSKFLSTDFIF
eukprot:TRINITY_DN4841_c0_g1_i1.p1 TRINITY_DN4841_c0_g1~~TRINITY_DN4841_c0_g1_i1.p1  ORF type:complete len:542 (-),score=129.04 TRINITY_DN4841_c0_g1_i1:42-1667(-)